MACVGLARFLPERIPAISRSGQISQFRICSDPVRLFWYQDFILKLRPQWSEI